MNRISKRVVGSTDKRTLQGFVEEHTAEDAQVYTDEHGSYWGIARARKAVSHSAGEYVDDLATLTGRC